MASINLPFSERDMLRLRATAKADGLTEEALLEVLKDICYKEIEKKIKDDEYRTGKNSYHQNFHDNFTPLDRG